MLASPFKRSNTVVDEQNSSQIETSRKSSTTQETARRSSLANLSLRLTRSKKSQISLEDSQQQTNAGRLGEIFFSLPVEIQSSILCYLDISDFYNLRLSSRITNSVLQANASSITRAILDSTQSFYDDEGYIHSLFRMPSPCLNTNYLLHMLHRRQLVEKTVNIIVTFIQINIYAIKRRPHQNDFVSWRERLLEYFKVPAWTVCHYLEEYRKIFVYQHPKHDLLDNVDSYQASECWQCDESVRELLASYPVEGLVPAYQFYHFLIVHLKSCTRAPTYAGKIERRLRGWSKTQANADVLAMYITLGGMENLARISIMKGTYSQRLDIIGKFIDKLVSNHSSTSLKTRSKSSTSTLNVTDDQLQQSQSNDLLLLSTLTETATKDIEVPLENITSDLLTSLPSLEHSFFFPWRKRIMEKDLVQDENELASPFAFIQRLMMSLDFTSGEMTTEDQQHESVNGSTTLME